MPVTFSIPPLWVLCCALLALLAAYGLYRKKTKRFDSPRMVYGLAILRGLSTFLILLLLFNPLVRRETHETIKPLLVFMQDHSASIPFAFKRIDSVQYRQEVEDMLNRLSTKYTIKKVQFGSEKRDTLSWQFNQSSTNISLALQEVIQGNEAENLHSIILASDGIYNEGASPLQMDIAFNGPIHTIALGDTSLQRDAAVNRVFANKMVYLNDKIAVKSDISALSAIGENLQVKLVHVNSNQTLQTQSITANTTRFTRSIDWLIPANNKGLQHYRVVVSPLYNEKNTLNNQSDFFVDVMDGKEKILVLYQAPHPDIQALKEALSAQKNYDITLLPASQAPAQANGYQLVILHNLPASNFPLSNLMQSIKQQGCGIWFLLGLNSNINAFNNQQNAIQVQSAGTQSTDLQAIPNAGFSYFNLPNMNVVEALPPLVAPLGSYKTGPNTQSLFKQQIGQIKTEFPLWVCQQESGRRIAVTCGEGLWRWRLEQYRLRKNTEWVDALIANTARFAATRQDNRPFRVVLPKNVFLETDFIQLDAELYNENREAVNTPDVDIDIFDEENKVLHYTLNRNGNAYSLPLGRLAPGHYRYEAKTNFNGQSHTATGSFDVQAGNLELSNLSADWSLLNQLSKQYQGRMEPAERIKALSDSLMTKEIPAILKQHVSAKPLIDYKVLFALLLLCLSAEWFLRKRNGQY